MAERRIHGGRSRYADGRRIATRRADQPDLVQIYLHYSLDLWFEKKIRPACKGEAYLTRFADDFVVNFQYQRDAEEFHKSLTDRFGKFGLELAEEKTRVMRFGRFVRADLEKTGGKPDTFDFLGFKHVCGTDRGGKFALVRVPMRQKPPESSWPRPRNGSASIGTGSGGISKSNS